MNTTKVGTKIYYTSDMANHSTITAPRKLEDGRYYSQVEIPAHAARYADIAKTGTGFEIDDALRATILAWRKMQPRHIRTAGLIVDVVVDGMVVAHANHPASSYAPNPTR